MKLNLSSNVVPLPVPSHAEKFIKLDYLLSKKCLLIETAILVSYLIGLHKHLFKLRAGEEFYCTRKQQIENTTLSERRLEKAEREAIEKGLIKKEKKGIPAKNYYTLNFEAVYALKKDEECSPKKLKMSQPVRTKCPNQSGQNVPTSQDDGVPTSQDDGVPTSQDDGVPTSQDVFKKNNLKLQIVNDDNCPKKPPSLDMKKGDLAEKLDELERENNNDETVMFQIVAFAKYEEDGSISFTIQELS